MANATVNKTLISPLPGSICRPYVLGGAADVGDSVYVASDGDVERADGSAEGTVGAIGVVTAIGTFGQTTGAAGDAVSVCVFGPVSGYSGATPGTPAFVSDDAGKISDAAGTVGRFLGRWDNAKVLFVNPAPASLPTLDDLVGVTLSSPTNGQVLKYNGTAWVNGTDATG